MNGCDLLEYVLGTNNDKRANNKSLSIWYVEYTAEPGMTSVYVTAQQCQTFCGTN